MSTNKRKMTYLIYGIIMSVLTVGVGIMFILSAVGIYRSAEIDPYSREAVAEAFSRIAIFVYMLIFGVIAGILLHFIFPRENADEPKDEATMKWFKTHPNHRMTRDRLSAKVDMDTCEPDIAKKILRERTVRLIANCVCSVVCTVAAFIALSYLCNSTNFTDEINKSIINAFGVTALWCFIAFDMSVACSLIIGGASVKREITLLREAVKINAQNGIKGPQSDKRNEESITGINIARAIVFTVAVAFLIVGMLNGGVADVLGKAIKLCTECVGLG